MRKSAPWWGEFEFAIEETKCWRIAERCVAIKRNQQEWSLWDKTTELELNKPITVGKPKSRESFEHSKLQRFMLSQTTATLIIEPSLADRAMITRPSKPIIVMPKQEVTLYVSSPMWMTVLQPGVEEPLADIPFWRPSDTWFGTSTMSGDLCYSKYTDAKMDQQLLETRSHRATTKVVINNQLETPLPIERLNLPAPALKLYVDANGEFWTDEVGILQKIEHANQVSHVRHSPPEQIHLYQHVSESRELSNKPSFLSSIQSLVG